MKKLIYPLPPRSVKKDYLFNMIGSICSSGTSVLLLIIVSHVLGGDSAGIFTLGYSTGQMMACLGTFEMHNIHITDIKKQFAFSDYMTFRLLSAAAMILVSLLFVSIRHYTGYKAVVITLLCLYMTLTVFSDLFQSSFHINGYLYLGGISQGLQPIMSVVGFSLTLLLTKNLIYAIIAMLIATLCCILFFDIPFNRHFSDLRPAFHLPQLKGLFFNALPLFISAFLTQYTFNAPKYAIDTYLTHMDQSYYGYLVMPAFFVNLFGMFIFRPQIVPLSEKWQNKAFNDFKHQLTMFYILVIAVTFFSLIAGFLLGIPVLNLLYATDLNAYKFQLMILLISGGFNAAISLTIIVLTVMRKQNFGIIAYVIAFMLSLFIPDFLVKSYGISGAAIAYLTEMIVLFVSLFLIFIIYFRKSKSSETKNSIEPIN